MYFYILTRKPGLTTPNVRAQGRLMEAAQHFRVAADLDPSDVDIHISLGNVLRQDGESAAAIT